MEGEDSAGLTSVSLKSAFSKDVPLYFKDHVDTDSSDPSCVSLRSDFSKDVPLHFKQEDFSPDDQMPNVDDQTELKSVFEVLEKDIIELVRLELSRFLEVVSADCMTCFTGTSETEEQDEQKKEASAAVLDLALHVLKNNKKDRVAECLKNRLLAPVCQCQLKSSFKIKFQSVYEGFQETGKITDLKEIYTELYILEEQTQHEEHELTQVQMRLSRPATVTLQIADILSPVEREQRVRTVVTKGDAGIGKTLLTQKFCLDWAEGTNQTIHFIFPFTFRELNLLQGHSISLYGLIGHFFPATNQGICKFEEFQCLFILDGLDECRLELDFSKAQSITDVKEKTSVEVLLVSIIKGTLLPSALIWITTRPAAASQIPAVCVDMVIEVRGFTDLQKEIYFRKKFRDEEQASKVLSHVKASLSIYNMCSIPVFCWITAKVMDNFLQTEEGKLPQTLTELYIHFLVIQAKVTKIKYTGKSDTDFHWSPEIRRNIMLLSKMAFEQLLRGNLIFYESDLKDCGINITEASVYSGLFSLMFKEERGLYQDKVFSFVHLSVQDFLAALHVHVTFMDSGFNLLSEKSVLFRVFRSRSSLIPFYKTAVDKALESPNRHLDLFLRFLLGLSLEYNQRLLRGLVRQSGSPQINRETGKYLKVMLHSGLTVERNLMLLQCLNELKDSGLYVEVQDWLSSEKIPSDLSAAQWSALVSILLPLEEPEFDLTKFQHSETALLMLMPVIKQSTKALLSGCGLSDRAFKALASELSSQSSLRELDLSNNLLKDSGLQLLCDGLKSPSCALHTLSLRQCGLSSHSCGALVSVLESHSNRLTDLDLSNNDLLDSGVETLCSALKSSHCKLETFRLSGCQVSKSGFACLVSALSSGTLPLKELDLSYNHPGESEVKQLTSLFQDPQKKIRLEHGGVERLKDGFSKYAYHLTFDLNTANKKIKVSDDNRKISVEQDKQMYPDHSERFDYWKQVLCSEGLTGRKYWEVEVSGDVYIAVTYKGIKRRGNGKESCVGKNSLSWSLSCSEDQKFSVLHQNRKRSLKMKVSNRIGVYLDWDSGVLSFYEVSSQQKTHLDTIKTRFTEEVYPAFRIKTQPCNSFISLCEV